MPFGSRLKNSVGAWILLASLGAFAQNAPQPLPQAEKVSFSSSRGFYHAPFALTLSTQTPDALIRYTLDGTAPTATHGADYKSPLWIDSTTVIRVVALKPDLSPSDVETRTFIFPNEVVTQSPAGAPYKSLPPTWGSNAMNYGMDRRISLPESQCAVLSGKYYFSAFTPESGLEPWVSDGTPQGTRLVMDINPGPRSSGPGCFTVFKNKVYFRADNGSVGAELWETDGTTANTKCVGDLYPGYSRIGGESSPSVGYSSYPNHLAATRNMLFFSACNSVSGDELFAFMGAMPSIPVKDIASLSRGSYPNNLTGVKTGDFSILYFAAASASGGMELWKSNGTTDGTVLIKDIREGEPSSDPQQLTLVGQTLYFTADNGKTGRELWISDGTPQGTSLVADLAPGTASSDPQNLTPLGDSLFFTASTPDNGLALYAVSGAAPQLIRVFPANNGKLPVLQHFAASNNNLLFFTVNGEPWVSNGSPSNAARLSDKAQNARDFTAVGDVVFFSAESDAGRELWVSNGSPGDTRLFADIAPGPTGSDPQCLADGGGGKLFFAAAEPSAQGAFVADGKTATRLSKTGVVSPQTLHPDDLLSIPSFSLTVNPADFFGTGGIYSSPSRDGRASERKASIEYLVPGEKGFQIDAGVRIRGGFSRSTNNPKHGLRFFFRDEYGGKLKYPLFGNDGASAFEMVDLRTFNNYSWSLQGDTRFTALRDQFARDLQLNAGNFASRGKYAYLYINGMFFGLYDLDERPGGDYGETYLGGKSKDYDVIKVNPRSSPPVNRSYTIYATNGDMDAWTSLWNQLRKPEIKTLDAYMKVQGLNPDGSPNKEFPTLIDLDNLIDYMLVIFLIDDQDAPLTAWSGSNHPNNFFAIRDKTNATGGFRFFVHDAEHTLFTWNNANRDNRVGPWLGSINSNETIALYYSNPQHMFDLLAQNPEFKLRVADRVNRLFIQPDGALRPENTLKTFLNRKQEIDRAIVAESARWGGSKVRWPLSKNVEWLNEVNRIAVDDPTLAGPNDSWLAKRSDIVLNQLKAAGYYPKIDSPLFNKLSENLSLANPIPKAVLYATTTGHDPRLPGGTAGPRNDGSSPDAFVVDKPIPLPPGAVLKARFRTPEGIWSPLTTLATPQILPVRVCEIMYDPSPSTDPGFEAKDYEYIRLTNLSDKTLDLAGVRIAGGIQAVLPPNTRLEPGKTLALAENPKAYEQRYKQATPYSYNGALSNDKDEIILLDPQGNVIQQFTYSGKWFPQAGGKGASLVPVNPKSDNATLSAPAGWKTTIGN